MTKAKEIIEYMESLKNEKQRKILMRSLRRDLESMASVMSSLD